MLSALAFFKDELALEMAEVYQLIEFSFITCMAQFWFSN